MIKEVIVVEGRDDITAVKRAVEAELISVGGFGINEKIINKIREAQMQKIPYSLIVGEKEVEDRLVSIRKRDEGDMGQTGIDAFLEKIVQEIEEKQ